LDELIQHLDVTPVLLDRGGDADGTPVAVGRPLAVLIDLYPAGVRLALADEYFENPADDEVVDLCEATVELEPASLSAFAPSRIAQISSWISRRCRASISERRSSASSALRSAALSSAALSSIYRGSARLSSQPAEGFVARGTKFACDGSNRSHPYLADIEALGLYCRSIVSGA
jgi:hypothetical protein